MRAIDPSGSGDVFSVICLNSDGQVVWRSDVGGLQARHVNYISGIGLVVCHDVAHDVTDSVTITRAGGSGDWSLIDEMISGSKVFHSTDSAATVQTELETIAELNGKVTVSGTDVNSGLTFTFDPSLGGMTGLRPLIRSNYNFDCTSASARDVTILDPSDGSILHTANLQGSRLNPPNGLSFVYQSAKLGSNFICNHRPTLTNAYYLTQLDSSASILSQSAISALSERSLASDGAGFYISTTGSNVVKYDSSYALQWSVTNGNNPLHYDGSYIWGQKSLVNAKKMNTSNGSVGSTTVVDFYYYNMCLFSDGNPAFVQGSNGGSSLYYGISKYTESGSILWNYADGTNRGYSCCQYGDYVIMGGPRV
jgi:hypothetical protein